MVTYQVILILFIMTIHLEKSQASCCNNCSGGTNNNCCNSNCCSSCQNKCTTTQCVNTCQSNCCSCSGCTKPNCCEDGDCGNKTTTSITLKPFTTSIPTTTPKNNGGGGGGGAGINNTLIANASSTNHINNKNNIHLSINVNSDVRNYVNNSCEGGGGCNDGSQEVVTVTVRVPVPVPVTIPSRDGCVPSDPPPVDRRFCGTNGGDGSIDPKPPVDRRFCGTNGGDGCIDPKPPVGRRFCGTNGGDGSIYPKLPVDRRFCGTNGGDGSIDPKPPVDRRFCGTNGGDGCIYPKSPPVPQPNCCVIVIPCATQGCNPYHHTCHGCQGDYGYYPVDPCGGGCFKRGHWQRESCTMGQCVSRKVDCSYCNQDYYRSYEGYSQCQGCYHKY